MSSVCHSYVLISSICHSYVLVCHLYVTPIYSYVIRISLVCHSYVIRMSLIYTHMSSLCQSYVLICHRYVTLMYLYFISISLVCTRMWSVRHSYILICHPYVTYMWFYQEPPVGASTCDDVGISWFIFKLIHSLIDKKNSQLKSFSMERHECVMSQSFRYNNSLLL